jgi:hypothetical protein
MALNHTELVAVVHCKIRLNLPSKSKPRMRAADDIIAGEVLVDAAVEGAIVAEHIAEDDSPRCRLPARKSCGLVPAGTLVKRRLRYFRRRPYWWC